MPDGSLILNVLLSTHYIIASLNLSLASLFFWRVIYQPLAASLISGRSGTRVGRVAGSRPVAQVAGRQNVATQAGLRVAKNWTGSLFEFKNQHNWNFPGIKPHISRLRRAFRSALQDTGARMSSKLVYIFKFWSIHLFCNQKIILKYQSCEILEMSDDEEILIKDPEVVELSEQSFRAFTRMFQCLCSHQTVQSQQCLV